MTTHHHTEIAAADAARLSADTDEIVHVRCDSVAQRSEFAAAICAAIDDDDCFAGDSADIPLEIVGEIDGEDVRVHLEIA